VILNLLTNAIEAMSTTSSRRVLRVSSELRGTDDIFVVVEDSGSGIEPKNIEHIFDPFFTTKTHGMGMGLSICRSIIEAHGGRLTASPCPTGGSMFQITLPVREAFDGR
jgi:signal transduction histidine kinase